MSHLGRPKGKRAAEFSLRPLVAPLGAALGRSVAFAEDCVGAPAESAASSTFDAAAAPMSERAAKATST